MDQLVKFNRALADHSDAEDPRLIDGIVLTKFDTIDDKVCQCGVPGVSVCGVPGVSVCGVPGVSVCGPSGVFYMF